jgi:transcriptional regulator with XRE-family HTH domain
MNAWSDYVRRVTTGLNQVQIAERTGIAQTAIGRWLRADSGAPRADYVVAFARAFNENPVEALIIAGYITAAEAGVERVRVPLSEYAPEELLADLNRRFIEGSG